MNSEPPVFSLSPLRLFTYREVTAWTLLEGSMLQCVTERGERVLSCLCLLESSVSFWSRPWEVHTFLIIPKASEQPGELESCDHCSLTGTVDTEDCREPACTGSWRLSTRRNQSFPFLNSMALNMPTMYRAKG